MERISQAAAQVTMPDPIFWYTLCIVLLAAIIWGIKKWLDSNQITFDKHSKLIEDLGKCVIELTMMTKVHEVHIQALLKKVDEQGDDIETLRDFYIVTYKK